MYSSTFGKRWVGRSYLYFLVSASFGRFSLRELTCMHCVYLALWTSKVLFGSFVCAIYQFSFIQTYFLTFLDYYWALKLLNHLTCHTSCANWLALHVKSGDCNPPETFYHIVSTIRHAFTHQMYATDDFIAPCIHLHSCLSHIMFDVWTSFIPCVYCVVDLKKVCTCIIRYRVVPCLGEGCL